MYFLNTQNRMRLSLSLYLSLFRMIADNLPREPLSQEDGELPLDSQQLDPPVMEALRMRNSLQEDGELPSLSQQLDPPVIEALHMRHRLQEDEGSLPAQPEEETPVVAAVHHYGRLQPPNRYVSNRPR